MLGNINLQYKHILVLCPNVCPKIRLFVEYAISKNSNLTLCSKNTTGLQKFINSGEIGYFYPKQINTGDYHWVVTLDDEQEIRMQCQYSRTFYSSLNNPKLSDIPIELPIDLNDDTDTLYSDSETSIIEQEPLKKPKLFLVGVGPGSPDLLTVKAARLLQTVPVIISDRLVSSDLFNIVPKSTRILFSRKVCGKANEAQAEINDWILQHLRNGQDVIRLKGGDPFVFGRGGEEWNLVSDEFDLEWVPGISSCIAAAGAAGIPVTHRGVADSFVVCTGKKENGNTRIPEYNSHRTLVLLMAVRVFPKIALQLQDKGYPSNLPVAIVYRATYPDQKVMKGTLETISQLLKDSDIQNHSTIILGNSARVIEPSIKIIDDRIEFIVIQPLKGDWWIFTAVVTLSIPMFWFSTPNWIYFLVCQMFSWALAYSIIDDTYITEIDPKKNTVKVTKKKFGTIHWVRVSNADELVNIEVAQVVGKKPTYQLQLEFMSDFGFITIPSHESLVTGEQNKEILDDLAKQVSNFLKLKPLPEKLKAENLKKAHGENPLLAKRK